MSGDAEVSVEKSEPGPPRGQAGPPRLRWRAVARVVVPVGLLVGLAGGLHAADAWLPLFPQEPGQRLTELFLRSLLVGYLTVLVAVPALLAVAVWTLVRARRRGRRRPFVARSALLLGSAFLAVVGLELTSAAWMAWVHRLPALPRSFPAAPPDGALSLVVIGGSSALGYPYEPYLSVGQIVAWQLERATPGRRVALDIRANLGRNLEDMHNGLTRLTRKPDAMIIYSGHNEFLSRFDTSRNAGRAESHQGAFLERLYRMSLSSPFCRLVYETVRKHRLGGPPPPANRHRLLDAPSFTTSELHERLSDFARRLEAIVSYCEQVGSVPVLVIPPCNESGYEPNRTVLSVPPSPEREAQLTAAFEAARGLERTDPAASIDRYRALVAEEPEFAEAHFRLGRMLEEIGAFDEARTHYVRARDLDGYPVRCRSDFARIYHEVAERHDCLLIDAPELLRERSPHGILDDSLFHDAHHPTFASHLAIAQAVLRGLHARRQLGLEDRDPAIDPAECAAHFKLDGDLWGAACVKAAAYYKHLAASRFDPSERLAKHERYMKVGQDLRAGRIRVEDAGVPGIGLSPSRTFPVEWWSERATTRRP